MNNPPIIRRINIHYDLIRYLNNKIDLKLIWFNFSKKILLNSKNSFNSTTILFFKKKKLEKLIKLKYFNIYIKKYLNKKEFNQKYYSSIWKIFNNNLKKIEIFKNLNNISINSKKNYNLQLWKKFSKKISNQFLFKKLILSKKLLTDKISSLIKTHSLKKYFLLWNLKIFTPSINKISNFSINNIYIQQLFHFKIIKNYFLKWKIIFKNFNKKKLLLLPNLKINYKIPHLEINLFNNLIYLNQISVNNSNFSKIRNSQNHELYFLNLSLKNLFFDISSLKNINKLEIKLNDTKIINFEKNIFKFEDLPSINLSLMNLKLFKSHKKIKKDLIKEEIDLEKIIDFNLNKIIDLRIVKSKIGYLNLFELNLKNQFSKVKILENNIEEYEFNFLNNFINFNFKKDIQFSFIKNNLNLLNKFELKKFS